MENTVKAWQILGKHGIAWEIPAGTSSFSYNLQFNELQTANDIISRKA